MKRAKRAVAVVGLALEHRVRQVISGGEHAFKHDLAETAEYVLMLIDGSRRYELRLWQENGICGSGWKTATHGDFDLKEVEHFRPFTHSPIGGVIELVGAKIKDGNLYPDPENPYVVEECDEEYDEDQGEDEYDEYWDHPHADIRTNVFGVSRHGSDEYYPTGEVWVHMELFRELKRYPGKRPVWIFVGGSGLGKSTIAEFVGRGSELTVYETDSDDALPDQIAADIVVIGNRIPVSVDEVKRRLFGDPRAIVVYFRLTE